MTKGRKVKFEAQKQKINFIEADQNHALLLGTYTITNKESISDYI